MYNNYSNYLNNSYINPYNPAGRADALNSPYQPSPRQEITKVNGREGANAYPLSANSSVLLLDINNPIVYLKQSDGGGFCSVNAYSITPLEQEQKFSDTTDLEKRIKKLEDIVNESYTCNVEQFKQWKAAEPDTKHKGNDAR